MSLKKITNTLFFRLYNIDRLQKYLLKVKILLKVPKEKDNFKLTLSDWLMLIFIYAFTSGLMALLLNKQHISMFIVYFIGFLMIIWSLFGVYRAIR